MDLVGSVVSGLSSMALVMIVGFIIVIAMMTIIGRKA